MSCSEGADTTYARQLCDEGELEQPWSEERLRAAIPWPKDDDNKYSRGKLLLVAGSDRYPGAACLAARAAQRMGAGYVEAFVPNAEVKRLLLGACPSAVVRLRPDLDLGALAQMKVGRPQAVCIGPGFDGGDDASCDLVAEVLGAVAHPVLVDGGALAFLGRGQAKVALEKRRRAGRVTVVTPHGGEAARLAADYGIAPGEPADTACLLSRALGAVVVLKGPDTYISDGETVVPMREGTSALAKAGTGDVLAGMVAALLAQGVEPMAACILGATLHARAGALAAAALTSIAVLPEDLPDYLPAALRSLAAPK